MLVHDGGDEDFFSPPFIENCEGEPRNEALANTDPFDRGRTWKLFDSRRGLLNRRQKVCAETFDSLLIEAGRFKHFLVSLGVEYDSHRSRA